MTDDRLLSQEEIDMLTGRVNLDEFQRDVLGEIGNIGMGSAATAMSALTNQRVTITTPKVSVITLEELREEYPIPCVICRVTYLEGLKGENLFIIKKDDAAVIVDLMMGGDGKNPPETLDEIHLSAIGEAMNQMMGSAATAMASMFDRMIEISPPKVEYLDLSTGVSNLLDPSTSYEDAIVQISFRMVIGDLVDSEIVEVIPFEFARDMVEAAAKGGGLAAEDTLTVEEEEPEEPELSEEPQQPETRVHRTRSAMAEPPHQGQGQPAVARSGYAYASNVNIDLIKKIPVSISVKLGSCVVSLDQVLGLGTGSVLKLDTAESQPVEVLANGQLVAKGEVVVVGERYGVRITEIANRAGRLESLKGA